MSIRIVSEKVYGPASDGKVYRYIRGYCDSDDVKPTEGIAEGSKLIETDTDYVYVFEEEKQSWTQKYKLSDRGSGSSSSGSSGGNCGCFSIVGYSVTAADPNHDGNLILD